MWPRTVQPFGRSAGQKLRFLHFRHKLYFLSIHSFLCELFRLGTSSFLAHVYQFAPLRGGYGAGVLDGSYRTFLADTIRDKLEDGIGICSPCRLFRSAYVEVDASSFLCRAGGAIHEFAARGE